MIALAAEPQRPVLVLPVEVGVPRRPRERALEALRDRRRALPQRREALRVRRLERLPPRPRRLRPRCHLRDLPPAGAASAPWREGGPGGDVRPICTGRGRCASDLYGAGERCASDLYGGKRGEGHLRARAVLHLRVRLRPRGPPGLRNGLAAAAPPRRVSARAARAGHGRADAVHGARGSSTGGRTRRVQLVRGKDETCPVSTGGGGGCTASARQHCYP